MDKPKQIAPASPEIKFMQNVDSISFVELA